jgi:hypothetical protein
VDEHVIRVNEESFVFLSRTVKLLLEKSGVFEAPLSPSYFQQKISIAIQRGNAASVLGIVAKSSGLEGEFVVT